MNFQDRTLILDVGFVPIKSTHWTKAVTQIFKGTVDVVEEYSRVIRSPSMEMKVPAVVRLKKQYKRKRTIRFSRMGIYLRDNFTCQYCGKRLPAKLLTLDHFLAKSKGGKSSWKNILTACKVCNLLKGDLTCEEAGMTPMSLPKEPKYLPMDFGKWIQHPSRVPDLWKPYLGWLETDRQEPEE